MTIRTLRIPQKFTHGTVGKTGLTPTITIVDYDTGATVVSAATMSPMPTYANGWYFYNFTTYDDAKFYIWDVDAGSDEVDARVWHGNSGAADVRFVLDEVKSASSDISSIIEMVIRILGLVHENIYHKYTWAGRQHVSSIIESYDSKANTETHDGSTGLLARYALNVTYGVDNNPDEIIMTREVP